jgi:NitT/TauT family transport system permease protein
VRPASKRNGSRAWRLLSGEVGSPLLFLVVILILWDLAVTQEWVSRLILARPGEVAISFVELLTFSEIPVWEDIWATTWETVAGFAIAAAFGIGLAIAAGFSNTIKNMLYPYIISLQVTPRIAIAPIILAALGFGLMPKIVIAALIAFFPVFVNTLTGFVTVNEDEREMFRSLGATRWRTFTDLLLPNSLPLIFAGLKTAMTLALIGAVVAEFIAADAGLGVLVQRFSYQLNMADAFAVLLILTVLGLLLYAAIEYLDRVIVFWTHDARMTARTRRHEARARRGKTPIPKEVPSRSDRAASESLQVEDQQERSGTGTSRR